MSDKITFAELVEKISAKTDQSEQTTNDFIHELAEIIETSLGTGEKISISGFGKFELRWVDERKGRNPQTGEEITIPGQNKVVFKPYKALRQRVNKPFENLDSQLIGDEPDESISTDNAPVLSFQSTSIPTPEQASSKKAPLEENLIVERESPVENQPLPVRVKPKPAKTGEGAPVPPTSEEEDLAWVFEQKMQHQDELSRDVQSNGSMKWSYTAAAIVVLLAIFLLVFFLNNPNETQTSETSTLPAQPNVAQLGENQVTDQEVYANSEADQAARSDDASETTGEQDQIAGSETDREIAHAVAGGESLWTIAEDQYGDPYLWPLIYNANKNNLNNPNLVAAGNSLQLPVLENSENLSQEERKMVALGYISVYDWILENQPDNARYYLWAAGSFSQEVLRDASENVNEADLAFATQG